MIPLINQNLNYVSIVKMDFKCKTETKKMFLIIHLPNFLVVIQLIVKEMKNDNPFSINIII